MRNLPPTGAKPTLSMIFEWTSSTLLLEAPSISVTSKEVPLAISRQASHSPQGATVGPCLQLSALAKMRAMVVLPVPRGPARR